MNEELIGYAASLLEDTQFEMDEYQTPELAFTAVVLDKIADLLDCTDPVVEHCKLTNTNGVTIGEIYAYAESANGEVLYLFYTDYNPLPGVRTKSNNECQPLISRPQGFYNQAVRFAHNDVDSSSSEYRALRYIYDNVQNFNSVNIVILSNYIINNLTAKKVTVTKQLFTDTWDLKKLYANLYPEHERLVIDLDFNNDENFAMNLSCLNISSDKFSYQCFLTYFPAQLLYNLYDRFSNDLYSHAIREFIGFSSGKSPNSRIKKTLISESVNFLAYNGGITAVAKEIQTKTERKQLINDNNSPKPDYVSYDIISFISDLKIVDGIQTISSIYYSKKSNPSAIDFDGVYVPAKIIVPVEDELNMIYNVSVFSHTRNKENSDSFGVLPFSLTMKELSRSIIAPNNGHEPLYWFFQRTKNQYKDLCRQTMKHGEREILLRQYPKDQVFDFDMLSKVWLCWSQRPADAIKGLSIANNLYKKKIDDGHYIPDDLYFKRSIALIMVYNFLMSKEEKAIDRKPIAAYTMAYLSFITLKKLNLMKIWDSQQLSASLETFLQEAKKCIKEKLNELAKQAGLTLFSYSKLPNAFAEVIVGVNMTADIRLLLDEYEQ